MASYNILGIHATDRLQHADQIQKVLTKYGSGISTRLGLHDTADEMPNGVILVNVKEDIFADLKKELKAIKGIGVKQMLFR
ncbi:MAG: hypothetical protein ACOC32_01595 [Nanoarchaeota archaeon]